VSFEALYAQHQQQAATQRAEADEAGVRQH